MEYRIRSYQYFDEYGNSKEIDYYVEYQTPFLFFWKKWKKVTHVVCGLADCIRTTTYFKSVEDAEEFIKNHLLNNKVYDGYEIKTVKSLNYKSE